MFYQYFVRYVAATCIYLLACSAFAAEFSANRSVETNPFLRNSGVYLGLGIGLSLFDPEMSGVTSHTVEDRTSAGGTLFLGGFIKPRIALELHAADLGTLEFGPSGEADYQVYGASGLAFLSDSSFSSRFGRYNPFFRLGVRHHVVSERNVDVVRIARNSFLVGAGVSVALTRQIALRLDAISYSEDARFLQAALLFSDAKKSRKQPPVVKTSNPPSEPVAALPELPLPDSDNDQVTDDVDECPDTQPRLIVEKTGCAVYDGIVSGVNFEHDSSTLTLNAKRVLDGVVETFNQHPDGEMTVHAHTDNTGSELYNQGLSERRARSVADYLLSLIHI